MHLRTCLIIILSICEAEETKKFVPGRSVVLKCTPNEFNSTVTWFYENNWIWNGMKFNKMCENEGRYEIIDENSLRINKSVSSDAGTYTCVHNNLSITGKHKINLISILPGQTNSTHSETQDLDDESEQTTDSIITDDQNEVDENHDNQKYGELNSNVVIYIVCCCGLSCLFLFVVSLFTVLKEMIAIVVVAYLNNVQYFFSCCIKNGKPQQRSILDDKTTKNS